MKLLDTELIIKLREKDLLGLRSACIEACVSFTRRHEKVKGSNAYKRIVEEYNELGKKITKILNT